MASAGYVLNNQMAGSLQAIASTYKSITRAITAASAPKRQCVFEIELSAVSAPNATDCQIQGDFTYCGATTAGTGTAATPFATVGGAAIGTPIDTAISTGLVNFSAEPTTFVQADCYWNRGFNQRSGVLWQAAPGSEIYIPATASIGPALRALSTNYTGNVIGTLRFNES